jgi:opacity protein-like surface antigen
MRRSNLKVTFPLFTVALLLSCAFPASARSGVHPFSLTLSGGMLANMTFGKLVPLPNTADVPEVTVLMETKFPAFGLGLGYLITERLEFLGTLVYGRCEIIEDVGIGLAGIPLGQNMISKAESFQYSAGFVYSIVPGRISPFLAAGVGALTLKTSEFGSSTKLLLEYGGGIKFDLTRHLSAFLDIKDVVSYFNYPQDFDVFFVGIYDPDFSKSQHRLGIRFSLSYTI